jgi:photosystem II stability/assembly factor-like uncharacterized protein
MKKRITRIMGVVLTAVLLATLVIGTVAVPAAAADLLFTQQATPGTTALTGATVQAASDTNIVVASPDGSTIFAADNIAVPSARIMRSTDGGANWAASAPLAGPVVAMVVSPAFATDSTVIIATATAVYMSTNGGITFVQMSAALAGTLVYTSLAISPIYGTDGLLLAGIADTADNAYGDCMVYGRPLTFGWVSAGGLATLGLDVTSVAFSPNFPLDATILAVGSGEIAVGTTLNYAVNFAAWGAAIAPATISLTATEVGDTTNPNAITSSAISLPSDVNFASPALRRAYVTTVSAGADDVYRVSGATVAALGFAAATGTMGYSIAFGGTFTAGTLFVGDVASANVWRCSNPTAAAAFLWLPMTTAPTGAAMAAVTLDPAFTTNNTLYSGSTGAESAVNVSNDGGVTWYQTGIIDTTIAAVTDFIAADASTMFMVTSDGGAGPESVWKTTNAGADWTRVLAFATAANWGFVKLSPAFATDQTLYFGDWTGTAIRKSANGGASWTPSVSPVPIADILVETPTTIYVGSSAVAQVQKSANSGWTWVPSTITGAPGAINHIEQAPNGDILVGSTAGMVYRSTNAGTTYSSVILTPIAGAGAVVIAFDTNYATNSTVYAAAPGVAGIFRAVIGTSTVWSNIDPAGAAQVTTAAGVSDIVLGSDGTLYASCLGANVGIYRAINPTAPTAPVLAVTREGLNAGELLPAGATLVALRISEGSNILHAIDSNAVNSVITWTDTIMSTVAPAMTAPRNKAEIGGTTGVLVWNAVPGATAYQVRIDTRPDFLQGAVAGSPFTVAPLTNLAVPGLFNGTKYYWQVRVSAPVFGPWGGDTFGAPMTFSTALGAPPAAPVLTSPLAGATGVDTMPLFQWTAMGGATSYQLQLADNPEFEGSIKPGGAAGLPGTAYMMDIELDYGKTYYWRVKGMSATGDSPYSVTGVFTVMEEPGPDPGPDEIIIQPPDVIIEQPAAVTPVWVWVVIGIGALLVIALIVLIVRTRRVP